LSSEFAQLATKFCQCGSAKFMRVGFGLVGQQLKLLRQGGYGRSD
jgi:hypothetical protein